jgi:hypothetical protein
MFGSCKPWTQLLVLLVPAYFLPYSLTRPGTTALSTLIHRGNEQLYPARHKQESKRMSTSFEPWVFTALSVCNALHLHLTRDRFRTLAFTAPGVYCAWYLEYHGLPAKLGISSCLRPEYGTICQVEICNNPHASTREWSGYCLTFPTPDASNKYWDWVRDGYSDGPHLLMFVVR